MAHGGQKRNRLGLGHELGRGLPRLPPKVTKKKCSDTPARFAQKKTKTTKINFYDFLKGGPHWHREIS
jgi:hypothetical protein